MQIDIITAFPKLIEAPLEESIIKRARDNGVVTIQIHNLRKWTHDRHQTVDDTPYGGGAGMIFKVEPLYECLSDLTEKYDATRSKILLTSPRGKILNQETAVKFSLLDRIIIICGHYKGVDQRIHEFFSIEEISIGDFVLSGGEVPALAITDAVVRLLPGAISDINSALSDSFNDDLLDCDYYTRPEEFRGKRIPEILLSGNHNKIDEWRQEKREEITRLKRPDLYKKYKEK